MDEELKKLMGDAYKEGMTSDEIQAFFKNQILGGGEYVNKQMAEAEKKKLQDALNKANNDLQTKMTDDEKKAAADQALKDEIEQLKAELLNSRINSCESDARSLTAKARLNAGIEDNDTEFDSFIKNIVSEDKDKTSKIANYITTIVEKAYEKGKSDATKNKLGGMGNLNSNPNGGEGGNGNDTAAEERAKRLAQGTQKSVDRKELLSKFK